MNWIDARAEEVLRCRDHDLPGRAILLATWGGTQYALGSPEIIGLALATVAAGAGFGVTKLRVAEPMPPLHVFGNGNFSLSMTMTFLTGREAARAGRGGSHRGPFGVI
jgi:hypothetical protein